VLVGWGGVEEGVERCAGVGVEEWRSEGVLVGWGGVEVQRCGGVGVRRCGGAEVRRCGGVGKVERSDF